MDDQTVRRVSLIWGTVAIVVLTSLIWAIYLYNVNKPQSCEPREAILWSDATHSHSKCIPEIDLADILDPGQ